MNDWPLNVTVAPSARPAKVPMIASAPSLLISTNVAPVGGVKPMVPLKDAPVRLTVPVMLS